jgi:hypothetical protein
MCCFFLYCISWIFLLYRFVNIFEVENVERHAGRVVVTMRQITQAEARYMSLNPVAPDVRIPAPGTETVSNVMSRFFQAFDKVSF